MIRRIILSEVDMGVGPWIVAFVCVVLTTLVGLSVIQHLELRSARVALILSILREHKGEWLFGLDFAEKSNHVLLFRPWLAHMLQKLDADGLIESKNFPDTGRRGGRPRRGYRIPVPDHQTATTLP